MDAKKHRGCEHTLDAETQAAVLAAADAAQIRGWKMSAAEAESKTAALAENGIIVYDAKRAIGRRPASYRRDNARQLEGKRV